MTRRILDAIDHWLDGEPWTAEFAAVFWGALCLLWWACVALAIRWLW